MLERVLQFAILNRVLIVLVTMGAAVFGAFTLRRLPIDAVPDITNNQIQINTAYASFSPLEIEKQVTFPVETALAGIPGLQSTRSLSRTGFSQVTAIFDDDVSMYFARNQVAERLSEARETLPPGAEPRMGPISTGLGEVYMWAVDYSARKEGTGAKDGETGWQSDGTYLTPEGERLTNELERLAYLRTVQDWVIRPQLRGIAGIAGIDSIGGYVKQYHVRPDPMRLVSYGLTFGQVIEALEKNNVSTGAGYIEHKGESYLVRATGRIERAEDIGGIVVATHGGTPVLVRDVASVGVGEELRTGSASENGEEVVIGTALMLIGANSRTVAAAVDAKMAGVRKTLPPGIEARTLINRTKLVNATITTVGKNLAEGAGLVVVVLLLLLGNVRAALICALAIPLSMLLTSIGMVESKVSGNLMSLGAIDFGLIVDGAVIIVENCLRRLGHRQNELGRLLTLEERLAEVGIAAKEMIQPSVFGQAVIITVYIPLLTLTGVEGKMFHPMAMTVIFALLAAFVLSLTFVPAMVALLIQGRVKEKDNVIVGAVKRAYAPSLRLAVRGRWWVIGAAVLAFAASCVLFTQLGQEFVPTLDEQDIALDAVRITSTSLSQATTMQRELERTVAKFPEVAYVLSKTGTAEMASDPMAPNFSDTFVMLKSREQWPDRRKTKEALMDEIRAEAEKLPGTLYEWTQPIQMRFNELISGVKADVAVKVRGDDYAAMQRSAEQVSRVLQGIAGAEDVKAEQTAGQPVMTIDIDRAAIARYGMNVSDVQAVIGAAIGGREVGQVFEGDRRFALVVRLPDEIRRDLAALEDLPIPLPAQDGAGPVVRTAALVRGAEGLGAGYVPLRAVAKIEIAEGPSEIGRENGKRTVLVQCNVRGRDLGSFVKEAQRKVEEVRPPVGGWFDWGGQFENLVAARERLVVVVPVCFGLIFVLLFGTFGSAKHALLVFSAIPLGLTGGVVALWLRGMPFSISAAVGFIALSGVAVLNALVMVSFINQLRREGVGLEEAISRGSLARLRPVLVTALVASLGFVPMALAHGTGAEVQKPLATVVIGGLVSSTLLTLLVLPALYRVFHRRAGAAGG